jgi:hypothetical protein
VAFEAMRSKEFATGRMSFARKRQRERTRRIAIDPVLTPAYPLPARGDGGAYF